MHLMKKVFFAAIATAMVAAAQNPIAADSPFQIRYASNLTTNDSIINITNSGANGAQLYGPGFGANAGNICVNVYAFSPDEQLISCCSCVVTPNGLVSLSVNRDLTSNTLTGVRPSSVVIKLVATATGGTAGAPDFTGSSCGGSAQSVDTLPLATGLLAWGTTTHTAGVGTTPDLGGPITGVTETAFSPATLSTGTGSELASIANRCRNIQGNGSSFGICASCRMGGLGAKKK